MLALFHIVPSQIKIWKCDYAFVTKVQQFCLCNGPELQFGRSLCLMWKCCMWNVLHSENNLIYCAIFVTSSALRGHTSCVARVRFVTGALQICFQLGIAHLGCFCRGVSDINSPRANFRNQTSWGFPWWGLSVTRWRGFLLFLHLATRRTRRCKKILRLGLCLCTRKTSPNRKDEVHLVKMCPFFSVAVQTGVRSTKEQAWVTRHVRQTWVIWCTQIWHWISVTVPHLQVLSKLSRTIFLCVKIVGTESSWEQEKQTALCSECTDLWFPLTTFWPYMVWMER